MLKYSAAGLTALWPCWFAWWWYYQTHVYPRGFLDPSWLWPVLPCLLFVVRLGNFGAWLWVRAEHQLWSFSTLPHVNWTRFYFLGLNICNEVTFTVQSISSLQLKLDWKRTIGIFVCSKRKTEFLSNWFWTQLFSKVPYSYQETPGVLGSVNQLI